MKLAYFMGEAYPQSSDAELCLERANWRANSSYAVAYLQLIFFNENYSVTNFLAFSSEKSLISAEEISSTERGFTSTIFPI